MEQIDPEVAQLPGCQSLIFGARGPSLQELGLLDQWTDDERLATGLELLANALIRAGALALGRAHVRGDRLAALGKFLQDREVEVSVAR